MILGIETPCDKTGPRRITADTYTHVLLDGLSYEGLLS
jgi:hypothetical protein